MLYIDRGNFLIIWARRMVRVMHECAQYTKDYGMCMPYKHSAGHGQKDDRFSVVCKNQNTNFKIKYNLKKWHVTFTVQILYIMSYLFCLTCIISKDRFSFSAYVCKLVHKAFKHKILSQGKIERYKQNSFAEDAYCIPFK